MYTNLFVYMKVYTTISKTQLDFHKSLFSVAKTIFSVHFIFVLFAVFFTFLILLLYLQVIFFLFHGWLLI